MRNAHAAGGKKEEAAILCPSLFLKPTKSRAGPGRRIIALSLTTQAGSRAGGQPGRPPFRIRTVTSSRAASRINRRPTATCSITSLHTRQVRGCTRGRLSCAAHSPARTSILHSQPARSTVGLCDVYDGSCAPITHHSVHSRPALLAASSSRLCLTPHVPSLEHFFLLT